MIDFDRYTGDFEALRRQVSRNGIRAAIFDIDGTLFDTNILRMAYEYRIYRARAYRRPMRAAANLLTALAFITIHIPVVSVLDLFSRDRMQRYVYAMFSGAALASFSEFAHICYLPCILERRNTFVFDLLFFLKACGVRIILLSTNLDASIIPIAKAVNADEWIGFTLTVDGGGAITGTAERIPGAEFKVEATRRIIRENNSDPNIFFFADSRYDLPAMHLVNFPYLVGKMFRGVPRYFGWIVDGLRKQSDPAPASGTAREGRL